MLRASVVVIASVPKKYLLFITLISGVLLALGFGIVYRADSSQGLRLGDKNFTVEYARTEAERSKGLSGRSEIGENNAMIFVSDKDQLQCFWMKDMRFAIDIIWLDANKRIVATEQNVSPSSYPESFCHNGQFVVEVAAGEVVRLGLNNGAAARF